MCREVALDKMPGVRPIGIGDVFRRLLAKCVLLETVSETSGACGSTQLCAGLPLGCEGAVHGMSALFDEHTFETEQFGFLLIDAANAFNNFSRIQLLWNVRHLWPSGAWFAFNCYKHQSLLVC